MTIPALAKLRDRMEQDYPDWRDHAKCEKGRAHRAGLIRELATVCGDHRKIARVVDMRDFDVAKILKASKGAAC